MQYTDEQNDILRHDPAEHACILAGPGTGKSSTIIAYIDKIHRQFPDKPARLLTFTRAANTELTEKIFEAGHEKVVSSTIHSFAMSVLLSNPGISGLPEPLRIADDWEWKELIKKDIAKRLSLKSKTVEILKNEMAAMWESLVPEEDPDIPPATRARFMGLWEEHRRLYGYTLLSELPFRFKIVLEGNPDLVSPNLELIAVDEYQDLNACDLKCFKLLAERGLTVIATGDEDQSIYQFRKAHPAGIRNFPRDYQAISYPLTISHRCGRKILEWANFVIEGDTDRPHKPPLRPSDNNPDGSVGYLVFNRESSEANGIVRLVTWLTNKKHIPLEEILILVRTGTIAKLIKKAFKKADIPYSDPEEALDALKHNDSRELFSILRLISNRTDSLAWWTLLHLTQRIGYRTVDEIYQLARQINHQFGEILISEAENVFRNISSNQNKLSTRVNDILRLIEQVEVPEEARWGSWIKEQVEDGRLPKPAEGVNELLAKIDDNREGAGQVALDRYISQIEPLIKDIMNSKTPGHTRIMTLSRSKGLTVRTTIIAGAEDGIIPHPKAHDPQEERRLLYVGMTRARDHLYITRCRRRTGPSARSGQPNVARLRRPCPFLDGSPVSQYDGERYLNKLGA
jgi:DNA helicase-2/ATP-dependent DNA helicase PcrA